jgi:hypothetical protein
MRSPSLNVEISRSKGQVQQILTGFYMVKWLIKCDFEG